MEIILAISLALIIGLLFLIYKASNKIIRYEQALLEQQETLDSIYGVITASQEQLEKVDLLGAFKADDEVGDFFKNLMKIQEELNKYILEQGYGKKEVGE